MARINYELKEKIVSLSGACFWFWNSFYSFLDSCEVPKSLYKRYPKDSFNKYHVMRNILEFLEDKNQTNIINNIISNFFKLRNAVDRDNLDEKKAKQLLEEFREIVGNDPIEHEIKRQKSEQARAAYQKSIDSAKTQAKRIDDINKEFIDLTTTTTLTPQQRGFRLESLFFDLLQLSEFDHARPYRTKDGEQIDGHFKYEKFDYLVEVKWIDALTKQIDLSIFDGKIRGKVQSTRGFFLSANGFDENAVSKFSGDSPRIILMTGEDFAIVLSDRAMFFDAMKAKVDAIVRYGNINFPLRKIAT